MISNGKLIIEFYQVILYESRRNIEAEKKRIQISSCVNSIYYWQTFFSLAIKKLKFFLKSICDSDDKWHNPLEIEKEKEQKRLTEKSIEEREKKRAQNVDGINDESESRSSFCFYVIMSICSQYSLFSTAEQLARV